MADPQSREEYDELFHKNSKITGVGVETAQHMPCPWCCEPDFVIMKPWTMANWPNQHQFTATCEHCDRTLGFDFQRTDGGSEMAMSQTAGPDAPAWMVEAGMAPPDKRPQDGSAQQ